MNAKKVIQDKRHQIKISSRNIPVQMKFALKRNAEPYPLASHGRAERTPINLIPRPEDRVQSPFRANVQVGQFLLEAQEALLQSFFRSGTNALESLAPFVN